MGRFYMGINQFTPTFVVYNGGMSENTADKYHKPYSDVVLEARANHDLFIREVRLHNLTIGNFHHKEVAYKKQITELEQKLIAAGKGRRKLVVHYEQEIRNLDGCQTLVETLQRDKPVDKK